MLVIETDCKTHYTLPSEILRALNCFKGIFAPEMEGKCTIKALLLTTNGMIICNKDDLEFLGDIQTEENDGFPRKARE